jgi:L-aspartate oxidase
MRPDADEQRPVYLDMRHVRGPNLHQRFPGISAFLNRHRLDLHRDLIPVRPAAHYLMGGIRTDLDGRTSLPGLFAAGEAACTGVHGANRLASNSLLEGLVFGARAAGAMVVNNLPLSQLDSPPGMPMALSTAEEELVAEQIAALQQAMWSNAGLLREEPALRRGFAAVGACASLVASLVENGKGSRRLSEARALCRVSKAILQSAVARTESRGAHFRADYPHRDDGQFRKHSILGRDRPDEVSFESW